MISSDTPDTSLFISLGAGATIFGGLLQTGDI